MIELLVVIAIIGILASIVLVSFPGASKRAKDSRMVSAVGQARTVMTYVYANEGSYDSLACSLEDMEPLCAEIADNHPTKGTNPTIVLSAGGTNSTSACMYTQLNAKDNYWYCADSHGRAGFVSTAANNPGQAGYCLVDAVNNSTHCPPFD